MSIILKKLEGMAGTNCSAIVMNNHSLASTFSKEEIVYLKLSQQAFARIFNHADTEIADSTPQYDEAHLQMGERRLICFRLEDNTFYISMVPQNHDIQKAQKIIRGALNILRKVVSGTSAPQSKV